MSVLEMLQSIPQLGAKRVDDVFRQLAFDRKPVQTRDGRLDGALSGAQFLGPVGALLSFARMGEAERPDHGGQHQALAHQSHEE